ncbi:uncharacterized protein VTP21DRAFT_8745 [Calcarisporiella thermophila]|uniref:uncharacterized protein n=1 Tax=Calcarisporiella thermophila TaxID=911321 RepID=UPI0037435CE0
MTMIALTSLESVSKTFVHSLSTPFSIQRPLELFSSADPLAVAFVIATLVGTWCLLASWVTGNCSQVDCLWSILPVIYSWFFAGRAYLEDLVPSSRMLLMAGLVSVWGLRLTYNYYRKGGYQHGAEDYRWSYIRKRLHPLMYQLLNLTFISYFQNYLLLGLTLPCYIAYLTRHTAVAFNVIDTIAAGLFGLFLVGEVVADEQQWRFQSRKHYKLAHSLPLSPGDEKRGFLTSGFFRYSRHPNFFCEISLWWAFYFFCVAATTPATHFLNVRIESVRDLLLWPIAAPVALLLLFVGSTTLTEHISAEKYEDYHIYRRATSMFVPLPPNKRVKLE